MTADDFDPPLTAEELATFDAEEFVIEWDESWTQEVKNAVCRELAAKGVIEWDEPNLKAKPTPKTKAEMVRRHHRTN